jgi:hypothetical protein
MTTTSKDAFVPKERGSLPRILMLDFEEDYVQHFTNIGYSVFAGHFGLGSKPFRLPKHESEIEIILWDTSALQRAQIITAAGSTRDLQSLQGQDFLTQTTELLARYCKRVGDKGGFVGVFLADSSSGIPNKLPDILGMGTGLCFSRRRTSTMKLHRLSDDDTWYELFKRFVSENNIHYAISLYDTYTAAIP